MSPTTRPEKNLFQKVTEWARETWFDKFRQNFLDRRNAILANQLLKNKILKDSGQDLDLLAGHSAHAAALFADRASSLVGNLMRYGAISWYKEGRAGMGKIVDFNLEGDIYKQPTGGLLHIFEPLFSEEGRSKNLYTKWHQYALALRGQRLNAEGKVVPMPQDEIAFGLQLAEAYPDIKIVHSNYQRWNDNLVQFLIDTGMINEKMGEVWRKYSDYIPFYKDITDETPDQVMELMEREFKSKMVQYSDDNEELSWQCELSQLPEGAAFIPKSTVGQENVI